jgi:PKD repeat protein
VGTTPNPSFTYAIDTNTAGSVILNVTTGGSPPTANFSGSPTSGLAPLQVIFADGSTGIPTSWAWDFDNNGSTDSTGQNPTNTYAAGTYTVKLTAINANGSNSLTKTAYITALTVQQSWQNAYGVTADATDRDGDGLSNTNEFLAGFNPTNSAAYAHVLSIVKSGSDLNITYLGSAGDSTYAGGPASRTNVLEFTTGTGTGSYTNNFASTGQTNILSGGTGLGVVASFVETNGATFTPSRYYRVRVLAP